MGFLEAIVFWLAKAAAEFLLAVFVICGLGLLLWWASK
jgi:hypothetical protein